MRWCWIVFFSCIFFSRGEQREWRLDKWWGRFPNFAVEGEKKKRCDVVDGRVRLFRWRLCISWSAELLPGECWEVLPGLVSQRGCEDVHGEKGSTAAKSQQPRGKLPNGWCKKIAACLLPCETLWTHFFFLFKRTKVLPLVLDNNWLPYLRVIVAPPCSWTLTGIQDNESRNSWSCESTPLKTTIFCNNRWTTLWRSG